MKNRVQKQLSFEPIFHRKVSQGKYIRISSNAIKVADASLREDIAIEREKILAQGFKITESDTGLSYATMGIADKGDVAAVIAQTNPLFKLNIEKETA